MKTAVLPLLSPPDVVVAPTRRDVVRLLGFAAVSTLFPTVSRAGTQGWNSQADYSTRVWKQRVDVFLERVLPNEIAPSVTRRVATAPCFSSGAPRVFSDQFSSPIRFSLHLAPVESRYTRAVVEIDELPYYDRANPCLRTKDLNGTEIERLLEPSEIACYGGVMSPCSERRPLTAEDRRLYRRTMREYEIDPAAYEPQYVRNFTNGDQSFLGFGSLRKDNAPTQLPRKDDAPTQPPRKNVFLSSFDVS